MPFRLTLSPMVPFSSDARAHFPPYTFASLGSKSLMIQICNNDTNTSIAGVILALSYTRHTTQEKGSELQESTVTVQSEALLPTTVPISATRATSQNPSAADARTVSFARRHARLRRREAAIIHLDVQPRQSRSLRRDVEAAFYGVYDGPKRVSPTTRYRPTRGLRSRIASRGLVKTTNSTHGVIGTTVVSQPVVVTSGVKSSWPMAQAMRTVEWAGQVLRKRCRDDSEDDSDNGGEEEGLLAWLAGCCVPRPKVKKLRRMY